MAEPTKPSEPAIPDIIEAMDHGKLRSVQVAVFGACLDMGLPGSFAGTAAVALGVEVMKAVKPAPEGERFAAAQAVIRQHLVGLLEGDLLDEADKVLTRTVIQALAVVDEQARRVVDSLTVEKGKVN